jgi:hypothetical protein
MNESERDRVGREDAVHHVRDQRDAGSRCPARSLATSIGFALRASAGIA